ncbi:MAG: glutathione-regulated potassium-efflux system protein KefC [Methanosaeta sp. PtaU1.Bin112]|nr:MAG: glutathione-regulated potassium-efflux system protein KefC [Methanosaeta sp. PtaU1.Bin112]
MMEIALLKDIVVIFALSVAVLLIFHRLRAPTIVGFLLTGILAGPKGLGLISASEQVSVLAEIGVVLLLFSVGMEISLKDLLKIKKYVLAGGSLQVALTILAVYAILSRMQIPSGEALIFGFLISLSSTAIVLRIIQKKEQFDSIYGRTTLSILIFQDLAVVPMMLIVPLLPGAVQTTQQSPWPIVAKVLILIVLVIVSAKWVVPKILYHIAKTGDRELFLLSIVAICLSVAWISSLAGLSLGLGAFFAGLIISESPYSHQAFGNVMPLRDAFTSFFFISIGMLLDLDYLLANPIYIILAGAAVMALKAVIAGLSVSLLGLPLRISVLVGLALSQIGEFSFILSKTGFDSGIISTDAYQLFLDVAVLTMGATSILMAVSPRVADGFLRLPIPHRLKNGRLPIAAAKDPQWKDHLVIIGYGINGRNVALSARMEGIAFVIVEMDPEIVAEEEKKGEPIHFGDASQEAVLRYVGIRSARVAAIAISDPAATRRITELARRMNPDLFIIVRTRYLEEMAPLKKLGADEVIPEEFETSMEIFARVLDRYDVPREKIEQYIDQIRLEGYEMFRSLSREPYCNANLSMQSDVIRSFKVRVGSQAEGRMVAEINEEEKDIQLLAIHRDLQTIANPDGKMLLQADDIVVLMGPDEKMELIARRFFIS